MAKVFEALSIIILVSACSLLTPLPAIPPRGPVTDAQQAIRIAINKCGGWQTVEEKYWDVRYGYQSWIAEYDEERTFWSEDDAVHVKAIIDESTGKLLNCINEAPVVISVD